MIPVIGAGLAGSEAAWYLAEHGEQVRLIEQKPVRRSSAHTSDCFCELVCSNSLKSDDVYGNACGLLKEEMRRLGSLTMEAAAATRVPAAVRLPSIGNVLRHTSPRNCVRIRTFMWKRKRRRSFRRRASSRRGR